ncbi:MAG: hypothetical protein KBD76_11890 [Bacteriovorax sp.]|nr:hypothetical protein [Bacteriovorax sp.]
MYDFETRNLNTSHRIEDVNSNKAWQLGWINSSGSKIISENEYYIDVPNLNLSDVVRKLTNFDAEKYKREKKSATEVWEKFKKVLYDPEYILVGQHILGFDIFLCDILAKQAGERVDYSKFLDRVYDTRAFGLAYKNNIEKPQRGSMLEWQFKILNDKTLKGKVSQTALLKDLGITSSDEKFRHSAIVDCRDTLAIFNELKKRLKL